MVNHSTFAHSGSAAERRAWRRPHAAARRRDPCVERTETTSCLVRALVAAIDAKDSYTCGHSDRVARYAARLALELGFDSRFTATIYIAGLLHDVGKIGIADSVLRKAGPLSDAEYAQIRLHPELGCRILRGIDSLAAVRPAVLHHHERWDGCGYPSRLEGRSIPLMARIIAVADAYDAMTTDRAYRNRTSSDEAIDILRNGGGVQWDPEVVTAFVRSRQEMQEISGYLRGAETATRTASVSR